MKRSLTLKKVGKPASNERDTSVFLVSLLFAFALWFVQNISQNYSSLVSVSVTATSNIEGHAFESSNSSVVVARCRTSGWYLLRNFTSRNRVQTVFFDQRDLHKVDDELFAISSESLANYVNDIFGDGVQLESFTSSDVQFRFSVENHKKVPVQPVYTATYVSQYTASSELSVVPDSVTIYGEPYQLQNIDRVYTSDITLRKLKSSAHGTSRIEPISGLRMSHNEVNYAIDVTRYVEVSQTVTIGKANVPTGKNISVYPSTAKVTYKCAFPITRDPSGSVAFFIDWNDFSSSINGRCIVHSSALPAGIISYSIDPQVFEVIEK